MNIVNRTSHITHRVEARQSQSAVDIQQLIAENISNYIDPAHLRALVELDPPSNNMGGTYPLPPHFIPHGEITWENVAASATWLFLKKQKTKIDYLTFSSKAGAEAIQLALQIVFPDMLISSSGVGMKGYPKCRSLMVDDMQVGLLGYGAEHGRDSVSLTGLACKMLNDERVMLMHEILQLLEARITRIDLCLDLYHGEMTWEYAKFCYERGDFRQPKASIDPERRVYDKNRGRENLGRTLYVGRRDGAVMARIYEKGLEVFANMPEAYQELSNLREQASLGEDIPFKSDDWLRIEIEYKYKKKDTELPHMMLLDRDSYFAGAYPFTASALGLGSGLRPKRLKVDEEITLDKTFKNMRASYGNAVHTLKELGFTAQEIVDRIDTGLMNQKLVKAGVVYAVKKSPDWLEAMRQVDDVPF